MSPNTSTLIDLVHDVMVSAWTQWGIDGGKSERVANVDSLRWLLADVFPRIRERIPGAVLVGGINMSAEHERLIRSCPGAQVLGFIDNVPANDAPVVARLPRGGYRLVISAGRSEGSGG